MCSAMQNKETKPSGGKSITKYLCGQGFNPITNIYICTYFKYVSDTLAEYKAHVINLRLPVSHIVYQNVELITHQNA